MKWEDTKWTWERFNLAGKILFLPLAILCDLFEPIFRLLEKKEHRK